MNFCHLTFRPVAILCMVGNNNFEWLLNFSMTILLHGFVIEVTKESKDVLILTPPTVATDEFLMAKAVNRVWAPMS